jgi:hypothetical protein
MDGDARRLVNVEEAKLEAYDPIVTQNAQNELYFNPLAMARLDTTVATPTQAIGFELLSEAELAIHFVDPDSNAAVSFKRTANKRTGRCSFSAILALMPYLKVPKGRVTRYPYRIDQLKKGATRFVVLLHEGQSEPSTRRPSKATAVAGRS